MRRERAGTPTEPPGSLAGAALAASLDPVIVVDSRGIVRLASDSLERVLGWAPSELIGRSVSVLVPEPDRAAHEQGLVRLGGLGASALVGRTRELVALHRDGSVLRVELAISAFADEGGSRMFCGVIHDISARAWSEDQREHYRHVLEDTVRERTAELERSRRKLLMADRLAAIGTLAAGLGHDMNNVLLPVRAHLNALEAAGLREDAREHSGAIRRSLAYLQQLADGLHFLALDPEHEHPEGATDLRRWWEQTGALLSQSVPRHVEVSASIPDALPEVRIAPHRLTQAVLNLLVNAGEAIPPRAAGAPGRVRVWADRAHDGTVRLGISDDGRGMTEEVRRRACEMFFTTKRRGMGTGLGLPLVQQLVERAGGWLEIESAVGRGTAVVLHLPAMLPPSDGAPGPGGRRVALALRDPRGLGVIRQLLEAAGARVTDDPADSDVWILDPGTPLADAEDWSAAGDRRQIVLFGSPPASEALAWAGLGAVIITDTNDLDSVRASLGRALAGP